MPLVINKQVAVEKKEPRPTTPEDVRSTLSELRSGERKVVKTSPFSSKSSLPENEVEIEVVVEEPPYEEPPHEEELSAPPPPRKERPVEEERPRVKKGTTLLVNGKEKKVAKNSAYLLDMLTLDDE